MSRYEYVDVVYQWVYNVIMSTSNNYFPSFRCPTANRLRLAWYRAATPLNNPPKSDPIAAQVIDQDREKPAYYGAKTRLQLHIESCPICKGES